MNGPRNTRSARPLNHRPLARPNPNVATALQSIGVFGFVLVLLIFLHGESGSALKGPGGVELALARFSAIVGTYLMIILVVLISRIPWLERSVGQDKLVHWHRRIGPWPLWLITIHVVLVLLGYAKQSSTTVFHQLWTFIKTYPDMLMAFVAYGLLMMAGITSIRIARRRLKYETWWVVHLYLYLALALSIAHQIKTGIYFITSPTYVHIWLGVWIVLALSIASFRVGLPVLRNLRHQLRVAAVEEAGPGVYSVICTGRRLERLPIAGGQFFQWRFLTRELWWHAHPYSLSALPRPPYIRFTVKALGDQSSVMRHLTPGTRVFIEGPYGAFTHHVRKSNRVALIGAGVGVTPLRALLEDLPRSVDVVVLIRASTVEDLLLHDEIEALMKGRTGRYLPVVGSREDIRLNSKTLRELIPDLASRDVYVCGPEAFSEMVERSAAKIGTDPERIHHEVFAF